MHMIFTSADDGTSCCSYQNQSFSYHHHHHTHDCNHYSIVTTRQMPSSEHCYQANRQLSKFGSPFRSPTEYGILIITTPKTLNPKPETLNPKP